MEFKRFCLFCTVILLFAAFSCDFTSSSSSTKQGNLRDDSALVEKSSSAGFDSESSTGSNTTDKNSVDFSSDDSSSQNSSADSAQSDASGADSSFSSSEASSDSSQKHDDPCSSDSAADSTFDENSDYGQNSGSSQQTRLEAPHIKLNGDILEWDAVEGAELYHISINGGKHFMSVSGTCIDLLALFVDYQIDGKIIITVTAVSGTLGESAPSETITYSAEI